VTFGIESRSGAGNMEGTDLACPERPEGRFQASDSFCHGDRLRGTLNLAGSADDTRVIAHNHRLLSFVAFHVLKLEHRDWAHIHAD